MRSLEHAVSDVVKKYQLSLFLVMFSKIPETLPVRHFFLLPILDPVTLPEGYSHY